MTGIILFIIISFSNTKQGASELGHSKAEKAQSRERILAAASTRIRETGLESITVGELMKSVNLTHGGFYGHFESRSDLIAAALERALVDSVKTEASHVGKSDTPSVKTIINSYLSPAHRDHPGTGCAIAAVAGEVSRADPQVRAIMMSQLDRSIETIATAIAVPEYAEQFAEAAWATMIGAITISRVFAGEKRADQVLASARRAILDLEILYKAKAEQG